MAITKEKRKEMEDLIYKFFVTIDPSKVNAENYKSFFGKMSDTQFDTFFKKLFMSKSPYLPLDVVIFERDLDMANIEKASKLLDIPLYEYVVLPFFSEDKSNPIVTPYKVPVGYIHEKRVQQTARKKNTTSIDITARDTKTGQVINEDKNGRQAIEENYCLMTYGASNAVKEFMSFRADDMVMKEEAYSQIRRKGYLSMEELSDNVENKVALNTFDVYTISMGLKTNLVTEGYLLKGTLK